jgi:hypothetical protein
MSITERNNTMYCHVQFYEDKNGKIELILKADKKNIDVTGKLINFEN